jgi:hypothetical protein
MQRKDSTTPGPQSRRRRQKTRASAEIAAHAPAGGRGTPSGSLTITWGPKEICCPKCGAQEVHPDDVDLPPLDRRVLIRGRKFENEKGSWSQCLVCAGLYDLRGGKLIDTLESFVPERGWFCEEKEDLARPPDLPLVALAPIELPSMIITDGWADALKAQRFTARRRNDHPQIVGRGPSPHNAACDLFNQIHAADGGRTAAVRELLLDLATPRKITVAKVRPRASLDATPIPKE